MLIREVFVALPKVSPDKVSGRLKKLGPTGRKKDVPDGRNVKEPEVAMIGAGAAGPPQSVSKKDSRMSAVLDVTGVPALKPIVGEFLSHT